MIKRGFQPRASCATGSAGRSARVCRADGKERPPRAGCGGTRRGDSVAELQRGRHPGQDDTSFFSPFIPCLSNTMVSQSQASCPTGRMKAGRS